MKNFFLSLNILILLAISSGHVFAMNEKLIEEKPEKTIQKKQGKKHPRDENELDKNASENLIIKKHKKFDSFIPLLDKLVSEKKTLSLWQIPAAYLMAGGNKANFVSNLSKIIDEKLSPSKNCKELAQKWIFNAGLNILDNDISAFTRELIANANDVTLEKNEKNDVVAGQFGMGFFSIFGMLRKHGTVLPESMLKITTDYQNDLNKVSRAQISITWDDTQKNITAYDSNLLVTCHCHTENQKQSTGTCMTLSPLKNNEKYPDETLKQLLEDLHKHFDYYPHVQINVNVTYNTNKKIEEIIGNKNSPFVTTVKLTSQELSVTDTGYGISPQTLFSKLLVPSTSSKRKVKLEALKNHVDLPKASINHIEKKSDTSFFVITVGGICVIKMPYEGNGFDVVIDMPLGTRLTLARNEILIHPDGKSAEEKILKNAIEATIAKITPENAPILEVLYRGLKMWEKQTAARHIQGRFTGHVAKELTKFLNKNKNIIPVPAEFFDVMKNWGAEKNISYVPLCEELVWYSYDWLQQHLVSYATTIMKFENGNKNTELKKAALNGELISGYTVFFVPETLGLKSPQSLGLRACLFVPEDYIKTTNTETANAIRRRCPITALSQYQPGKTIDDEDMHILISDLGEFNYPTKQEPSESFHNAEIPYGVSALYVLDPDADKKFQSQTLLTLKDEEVAKEFLQKNAVLENDALIFFSKFLVLIDNNNADFDRLSSLMFTDVIDNKEEQNYRPAIEKQTLINAIKSRIDNQNDFARLVKQIFEMSFLVYNENSGTWYVDSNRYIRIRTQNEAEKIEMLLSKKVEEIRQKLLSKNAEPQDKWIEDIFFSAKNAPIKQIPCYKVVNMFLTSLLITHIKRLGMAPKYSYDQLSATNWFIEQVKKFDENVIYKGTKQIWPLPKKITSSTIENLFFSLVRDTAHKQSKFRFCLKKSKSEKMNLIPTQLEDGNTPCFISLKSRENVETFVDLISKDKLPQSVISSEVPLKKPILGFSLIAPVLNVLALRSLNNNTSSPTNELPLGSLESSLLSLYQRFSTFSFDAMPTSYASEKKAQAFLPDTEVTTEEIKIICSIIAQYDKNKKSELLDKLMKFTITDMARKTDPVTKIQDLLSYKLYIPQIRAHSPLSLLALLHQKLQGTESSKKLLPLIIKLSRSPEELLFMASLCIANHENILNLLKSKQAPQGIIKGFLTYIKNYFYSDLPKQDSIDALDTMKNIFVHYIQEYVDFTRMENLYEQNRKEPDLKKRLDQISQDPASTIFAQSLQESTGDKQTIAQTQNNINDELNKNTLLQNTFQLSQLIAAYCANNNLQQLIENGDIAGIYNLISKIQSLNSEIGKITQNTENGSEKGFYEATIIETLQNCIDAARRALKNLGNISKEQKKQLAKIYYTVQLKDAPTVDNKEMQSLVLTVKDFAGFPDLKKLFTFILPDASDKSSQNGDIGTMGNGSFKMYQHAQLVYLLTRTLDKQRAYVVRIEPLRNEQNFVYDIKLAYQDVTDQISKDFVGTSIKITHLPETKKHLHADLLVIKDFFSTAVSTTQATIGGQEAFEIYLGSGSTSILVNPTQKKEAVIYESSLPGEQKIAGNTIKITKRPNPYLPSFITTGGLPFLPFTLVAREMKLLPPSLIPYLQGVVIDLGTNLYSPVQSRTHLKMDQNVLKLLKKVLFEATFAFGLADQAAHPDRYSPFTHMDSKCSTFSQIRLSQADHDTFINEFATFIDGTSDGKKISPEDFFDYYEPLCTKNLAQRSFFDHIEHGCEKLVPLIENEKETIEQSIVTDAKIWINKNKSTIDKEINKTTNEIDKDNLRTKWIESFNKDMNIKQKAADFKNKINELFAQWLKGQYNLFSSLDEQTYKHFENPSHGLATIFVKKWFAAKIDGMVIVTFDLTKEIQSLQAPCIIKYENKENLDYKELWNEKMGYYKTQNFGPALEKLMSYFVSEFFTCMKNCKYHTASGDHENMSVKIYYRKSACAGYVDSSQPNTIFINAHDLDIVAHLKLLLSFVTFDSSKDSISKITNEPAYNSFYAVRPLGNATTLWHECEHMRRGDNSKEENKKDFHTKTTGKDADGNQGASFEACANNFANFAFAKEDLLNKVIQKIKVDKDLDAKSFDKLGWLKSFLYQDKLIAEYERKNKKFLCEQLGIEVG